MTLTHPKYVSIRVSSLFSYTYNGQAIWKCIFRFGFNREVKAVEEARNVCRLLWKVRVFLGKYVIKWFYRFKKDRSGINDFHIRKVTITNVGHELRYFNPLVTNFMHLARFKRREWEYWGYCMLWLQVSKIKLATTTVDMLQHHQFAHWAFPQ